MLGFLGAGCLGGGGSATADGGGVYVSEDSGKTWDASNALPTATAVSSIGNADVTSIAVDPEDDSAYYVGTVANGVLFSYDSGASWQRPEDDAARSGKVIAVRVDPRDVCTYFVAKTDRVLKTTTCGRTFDEVYVESRADESVTAMVVDWYNADVVYVTTTAGDVLRSTNGGVSWAPLYRAEDQITAFAVSNADSRVLLLGTRRRGLMRSTDGGANWTSLEKTLLADYAKSDRVYAFAQTANGGTLYMTGGYGILASSDNGATWTGLSLIPSTGEVEVSAIAVAPKDGNNIFFTAAHTLYHSVDGGANWTTSELPSSRSGAALMVDPANASRVVLGLQTVKD